MDGETAVPSTRAWCKTKVLQSFAKALGRALHVGRHVIPLKIFIFNRSMETLTKSACMPVVSIS